MQAQASRSVRTCAAKNVASWRVGKRLSRVLIVKAETGAVEKSATAASSSASNLTFPEWVPEQATPVLEFFTKEDFSLQDTAFYKKYLQQYVETEYFDMCTGFKAVPEVINGRAAMLGFVAAAGAELFGAGSFLAQLSKSPQPVLLMLLLVVAGSIVPIIKGSQGEYLDSLKETYTIPEGIFTESMEKLHGRLAMVGIAGLLVVELLKASPLL